MENKILLVNQKGFSWIKGNNVWCKGFVSDREEKFYSGNELAGYFSGIATFIEFEERVKQANGCFSVIYKNGNDCYAACDNIRSFPLFYRKGQEGYILSDSAYELSGRAENQQLNEIACIEFLATGFVTGAETLVKDIYSVQAGEINHFSEDGLKRKFYFTYRTDSAEEEGEDSGIRTAGMDILNHAFKRFIAGLNGRTVLVPLSGGYDSRLIAVMLKKSGYEKVICFTYGRKSSPEIEISRQVADRLGFKWIYIEYNDALIAGFMNDEDFRNYYLYAANLVSMFFMQEYFAVKYLKDNKLIPPDSIFVPGHSGDFLGGSQLYKHANLGLSENTGDIVNRIYYIKYCHKRPGVKYRKRILQRIRRTIEEKYSSDSDLSYSIHEDWDFKEKLAKFNFNSSAVYTYFGYEFRFPFWDYEIISFFKVLPLQLKINKCLYDDILREKFFRPRGLNFEKELQPSGAELTRQKMKNRIKYLLPEFFTRLFMKRDDDLFYREITRMMANELANEGKRIRIYGNSYNSLIIQWYIEKVRGRIVGGG